MPILDDLKKTLAEFPSVTPNAAELARLQQFFERMKALGVAKTREYDIPPPDTIGRALVNARGNAT
jgi:hypothetical protein